MTTYTKAARIIHTLLSDVVATYADKGYEFDADAVVAYSLKNKTNAFMALQPTIDVKTINALKSSKLDKLTNVKTAEDFLKAVWGLGDWFRIDYLTDEINPNNLLAAAVWYRKFEINVPNALHWELNILNEALKRTMSARWYSTISYYNSGEDTDVLLTKYTLPQNILLEQEVKFPANKESEPTIYTKVRTNRR